MPSVEEQPTPKLGGPAGAPPRPRPANGVAPTKALDWDRFAKEIWEQRTALVEPAPGAPLDAQAIFDTVVRWCDLRGTPGTWRQLRSSFQPPAERALQHRELSVQVRFLVEGAGALRFVRMGLQYVIPRDHLPLREDGSFEGYYRRLSAKLNPWWRRALGLKRRRFAVIFNNLEKFDPALWRWGCTAVRPLYERVGMNNTGSYLALFVGDYSKTAFGVHLDPESVFHIPIVGSKAMRTWPESYTAQHQEMRGAMEYGPHLGASTYVNAEVGQAVYWPSPEWHISEGKEALHVSLALSLQLQQGGYPWDDEDAPPTARAAPPPRRKMVPFDPNDLDAAVAKVPEDVILKFEVDRSTEAAHLGWIERVTGMGFINVPEPRPAGERAAGPSVSLATDALVASAVLASGALAVGSNGHVVQVRDVEAGRAVLAQLKAGAEVSLDGLGTDARAVVDHLHRTAALR